MAMKRCPVCGERYSDTYRNCPFCEEEKALRSGNSKPRHHRGGHRVVQKGPSLLSPLLILAIVVMAGILVYLLFGDTIAQKLGGGTSPVTSSAVSSQSSSGVTSAPPVSSSSAGSSGTSTSVDVSGLPETLSVTPNDFTMKVGDAPVKLTVSGGTGTYTWTSEDDGIASVDETGRVIAVSSGTVTVTASDGSGKGSCIVRIKGTGTPNAGNAAGTLALNRTDFTLSVGESFRLAVSGTTSAVTWSSSNAAVASVTDGLVKGIANGTATVSAVVDGKTLTCIVRIK